MFKVLVIHVKSTTDVVQYEEEIFETISEYSFLEKLYTCGLAFEYQWVHDKPYHAELIIEQ